MKPIKLGGKMKRLIALLICMCLILSACTDISKNEDGSKSEMSKSGTAASGVWLTFSEINTMLSSQNGFEAEITQAVNNCKDLGLENIYIHIRSYCDSLFKSDYFPLTEKAQTFSFDVFDYMIDAFHNADIKVHAWINPYRVQTSSADINLLRADSPAYKWLKDEDPLNDRNVCIKDGIYLNPAEAQVRELVISGVKEVITRYDVDGIHFDDYFYPTTDAAFDSISYEAYKSQTQNPLSLEDWRRSNVNLLISSCYTAIKNIDDTVLFTVSPAASIEKNYNEFYADVAHWVENGYIDWIIPQLYFGFNYPDEQFQFVNLLSNWKELGSKNTDVELHIGLASYKIGSQEQYDKEEWNKDSDIIARQAKICRDDDSVCGYVLFSYTSIFSNQELNTKQRQNYKNFIKVNKNG